MSDVVKRLRERRANVWESAKELADRAADENRAFSAEEQGAWDAHNEELGRLDQRIKAALDVEARNKETEKQFEALERRGVSPEANRANSAAGASGGASNTSEELRKFLTGESGSRAFEVRPQGPVNYRDLVKSTADTPKAGYTVPVSFYDRLMEHLIEVSAIMQAEPTVLNTSSGEVLQVPKTTAHSSAAIVSEGGAIAESDPTFGQVSLGAYKYGVIVQVSRELLTDNGVDLEGYLARQTGRALGNAFGAHAVTGTGTSQPRGIVTDATVGKTGGTGVGGKFTADDLMDLYHSVIAPYRMSSACRWILNDASIAELRKLKDTTGQYLWQPGLQAGAPDVLLGKPVLTDPNVANVATSAKSVIFGDISQYFVRLAGGIRFERSDDFAFNTDLVTFRALMRADAALIDLTGAVKVFAGAAS